MNNIVFRLFYNNNINNKWTLAKHILRYMDPSVFLPMQRFMHAEVLSFSRPRATVSLIDLTSNFKVSFFLCLFLSRIYDQVLRKTYFFLLLSIKTSKQHKNKPKHLIHNNNINNKLTLAKHTLRYMNPYVFLPMQRFIHAEDWVYPDHKQQTAW